jgi:hypothetical protein
MLQEMTLKVEEADGMFPNERAVSFHAADGKGVSLFVSRESIKAGGRLRVRVLDYNESIALVELPSQSMSTVSSVVQVDRSELEPSAP